MAQFQNSLYCAVVWRLSWPSLAKVINWDNARQRERTAEHLSIRGRERNDLLIAHYVNELPQIESVLLIVFW